MRIVTVIGARPQFIKSAVVSRAFERQKVEELILHTGQHYDANMNDVFVSALGLKQPRWQLHCGGIADRAKMLAEMLAGIDRALKESRPDYVLVYGDTTSTLAGALAASALQIPLIHIEAGLRSFNRRMPEETNRVLTDHIASLLFCPTYKAIENLAREGITEGMFHTGDVMYDAALVFGEAAERTSDVLTRLGLQTGQYRLCTVHRAENTDVAERLTSIVLALTDIATADCPVVMPLHPRTAIYLRNLNLMPLAASNPSLRFIEPVNYLDMLMLEKNAATILTDSGGVQKEAYFQRVPCITLRDETEWVETVEAGWNTITGCDGEKIVAALGALSVLSATPAAAPAAPTTHAVAATSAATTERKDIAEYGDGHAADKIVETIIRYGDVICGRKQ
jgi:UDP-GlcNAc3NAcA epimerase